ncbi:MmgE/PrpD family protein [Streptosporangium sp. NPDC006007]|uniref:MmgE/PrpD family protein n=1 Tax=Streptosporangium sp. NPDC006007 TaxID=3154575 RepID=UPI00339DB9CB
MKTASFVLADFAVALRSAEIPHDVRRRATLLVLNAVGLGIANAEHPSVVAARSVGRTEGRSTTWGDGTPRGESTAALANAIAVHISDFDDTHPEGGLHPAGVVVPAVLAVAEQEGWSGDQVVRATVVGLEVMARIASAAPHRFTLHALHASSVCGTVATAAAVAMGLGLDSRQVADAMGIAASQSSGILQTVIEGGDLKSFHLGWAALAGIWAARLAAAGLTGPHAVLEGEQGLFAAFLGSQALGEVDLPRLTRGLFEEWETTRVVIKPYPCCHFTHAPIDAARRYVLEHGPVDAAALKKIASVECRVPREAVHVVCEPAADKLMPSSGYAAKFSLYYCLAVALQNATVQPVDFLPPAGEPFQVTASTAALMGRINYTVDPDPTLAHSYGAEVVVRHVDGGQWSARVLYPTGSLRNPVPDSLVMDKFTDLVRPSRGAEQTALLLRRLLALSSAPDVAGVLRG